MRILLLEISFYLPGCRSLKEKRQRLGGLADKAGKLRQIAVAETGDQNRHQHSTWAFVILAGNQGLIDRQSERIQALCHDFDAIVSDVSRRWLQ